MVDKNKRMNPSTMEYLGHTNSSVYMHGPRITSAGMKSESGLASSAHNQACTGRHYMTAGAPTGASSVQLMTGEQTAPTGSATLEQRQGSTRCQLHPPDMSRRLATSEWKAWTRAELAAADQARAESELVRADVLTACRGLCDRTRRTQADTTHQLDDRANDIKFWRDEIRAEADAVSTESAALEHAVGLLDRALAEAEVPLNIAEECLHLREQRIGVDLIRDDVEVELIKVTR